MNTRFASPQRTALSDFLASEGGQAVLKAGSQVLINELGPSIKNTGIGGGTNVGGVYGGGGGGTGGGRPVETWVWIVGGVLMFLGVVYVFFGGKK